MCVSPLFYSRDALYKEQVAHFGTPDGSLREMVFDDIRELKVLDAVVRETLRLHPPIHSLMRKAHVDIPVPATLASPSEDVTYVVPKGDIVLASPIVSQMDPTVWDDSDTWEPLRWYDEKGFASQAHKQYNEGEKVDFGFGLVSKGTVSPYLPFGAGRHRCIGEQVRTWRVCLVRLDGALTPFLVCVPADQHHHLRTRSPSGVPPSGRVPQVRLHCALCSFVSNVRPMLTCCLCSP